MGSKLLTLLNKRARVAFSPADISGLKIWLKSDTGLYQDSAGTTPVAANTDPVGLWQDQSGNGHHFSQTTAGSKPTYRTNLLNSYPAIRADGVDDFLDAGKPAGLDFPGSMSIFAVFAIPTNITKDYHAVIANYNSAGSRAQYWLRTDDPSGTGPVNGNQRTSFRNHYSDGTSEFIQSPKIVNTAGQFNLHHTVRDDSAKTVNVWVNGGDNANVTYAKTIDSYTNAGNTAIFRSGSYAGDYANFDLVELIMYNAALTTAQQTQVKNYIAAKYGLTVA